MDLNIKLMKGKINWNHSVQFAEQWHFKQTYKGMRFDSIFDANGDFTIDTVYGAVIDRLYGFWGTRDYSYSTSFNTTLYGLVQFKRGLFRAFRHVMTPSIGFSINPNFLTKANGYHTYIDKSGQERTYNLYDGSPAGRPSRAKSGSINFSLGNNFEMKLRDRRDTVTGTRKIKLLDRLNLSTSYNLAADSMNWAPLNLSAQTTLFKTLVLSYNARFSFYAVDSNNRPYNKFIWETDRKLLLLNSESMNTSLSWSFGSKESKESNKSTEESPTLTSENTEIFEKPAAFDARWSLNISYTIGYGSNYNPRIYNTNIWGHPSSEFYSTYNRNISQTLSFNGNLNLTPKWNISFNSGFDFATKKLSQTMFNINRDLHCWNMSFTWAPFGLYKEWSFNIKLKSNMLGDVMKYDKKKSHRDTDNYN